MIKHLFIPCILILLIVCTNKSIAQQTNSNKDYSAYLPEVRAFKQHPQMAPPDSAAKTIIKPSVKYIQTPAGNLALRIFKPGIIRAVVLDIHGGGWSGGIAAFDDNLNDEMARICKVAVVSVDYRLASDENPFPACMIDCNAAAKWLVNNALKEFGTDKLFISGASSGAHLTATTTLYIRDSLHAIDKVKGVNLLSGCFDLSHTPSSRLATDTTFILSKQVLETIWENVFHGWSNEQLQNPQYSPLYAHLENLPPAIFTIGTEDPFIDDTYFMEARWRLAGNKTYLATYPESPHAFNLFPTKMAKAAYKEIYEWINGLCEK